MKEGGAQKEQATPAPKSTEKLHKKPLIVEPAVTRVCDTAHRITHVKNARRNLPPSAVQERRHEN